VPQTPVRLDRASGSLIDDLPLWSSLTSLPVPVPSGQWAVGVSLIVSSLLAFGLYGLAVSATWARRAGRRILVLAGAAGVLFSLVSALALPNANTDIYNYIVTGRVAAAHDANPYEVAPDRFASDPLYPYAEHRYTANPDVKLPAWMLVSVPLARAAGDDPVVNLLVYRFAFFAFGVANLVLVAAIMHRVNPRHALSAVVAWGWNPIVVIFGTNKVDTLMVFFLLLAVLLFVTARPRLGAVSLMLSALVKLITLPFAATYWLAEAAQRRWRRLAAATALMAATVIAAYLPFGANPDLMLDHLGLIERRGSGGNPVDGKPSTAGPARLLLAVGFGFLVLWVGLTQGDTVRRLLRGWGLLAVYFALFLVPLGLSWYLMAAIAVASLAVDWRLLLLTGLLSFSSFLVNAWDSTSSAAFPLPDVVAVSRGTAYLAPVVLGALVAIALLVRRGNRPAQSA
jgi:MFS family permease